MSIYSADFETTTAAVDDKSTRVWAGAIVDIEKHADDSAVVFFQSIDEFIEFWENDMQDFTINNGDEIYFHNLKFDGSFILNELIRCGYKYTDENLKKIRWGKHFSTLISDMGTWYQIQIRYNRKLFTIKNSLCLVASSVAAMGASFGTRKQKLDMDYDEAGMHTVLTKEDKEYIAADVLIVAEVLHTLIHGFEFDRLTAGANSLSFFIEHFGGKTKFRAMFPYIANDEDAFIRNSYKGGWCYVNPKATGMVDEKGATYDVNSLYPSMMHSMSGNIYPYGEGVKFEGAPPCDIEYPLWIAKCNIKAFKKPNKFPCVQIKSSSRFQENEWLESVCDPETEEMVELTITSVDWELIQECYEVDELVWLGGYKYKARKGMFDSFIEYWYEIKRTSKGAKKQLAKIILNSFYGKFGTRTIGASKIPFLSDGILKFKTGEDEERKGVYLPVACFTTAYSRRWTITAANANFERFCYADTDSIHIKGWEPAAGIVEHPSNMCSWKCESKWDSAKFLRQKTYMEHAVFEDGEPCDSMVIKCAGMPESIKYKKVLDVDEGKITKVPQISFDDFHEGAEWATGKLEAKQVKGGVLLLDKPFTIRP